MEDSLLAPFIFWGIYIVSNLLTLLLLWITIKRPGAGRLVFSIFFAACCLINISKAMEMSWLYTKGAEIITLPYHFFLGKALGDLNKPLLWITAGCQGLASIALTRKGLIFVLGCWCGMILLIALFPIGLRAAFPAPAIAAFALYYLQKLPGDAYLTGKTW
jgi:hypothetical protein